jgi:anti-sigma28 factor (negative regulator of flagellin synthesis)
MKIGQPNAPLPPDPATTPAPAVGTKPVGDTTSISSGIGEAKQSVENNRVALVQQLAAQVSRGSYQPNAQQIADAILDEAIVDAELEAAG